MLNAHHDIVVIGGSAGAIEALLNFVPLLPADLPAAIFVVIHIAADSPTALPQLLAAHCQLRVALAVHNAPIRPGHIHIAPPDYHLLLDKKRILVVTGPRENGFRPAIDPLFRSAALHFGPRVLGVVLSGGLDDGTAGLTAIKLGGGMAIAEDPADAPFPSMPSSAVTNVELDHIVPLRKMADRITQLVHLPTRSSRTVIKSEGTSMGHEKHLIAENTNGDADPNRIAPIPEQSTPRNFACPDCGGSMWELASDNQLRFRCHTGHLHTADTLAAGQKEKIELALWSAVRALQESAELHRRMARRMGQIELKSRADGYLQKAGEAQDQANILHHLLTGSAAPIRAAAPPESIPAKKSRRHIKPPPTRGKPRL